RQLNGSIELFDSELERSTVALIMENQGLQQENKQLTTLMTEYESTLETQIVADKQSALRVHYEHVLATGEGQSSTQTYNLFTLQQSMERLRRLLELAIKNESGQGEDADLAQPNPSQAVIKNTEEGDSAGQEQTQDTLDAALEGLTDGVDWAMEREAEIARLTEENQRIRKELGILEDIDDNKSDRSSSPLWSQMHSRSSSAPFGSGFTTMPQMPSPQPSPLVPNPFSPAYPGAQGYNPPAPPARERLDLAGGQPPLL
ncbi:4125_t:CDS:2, partial [Acaulospora colombiana]